LGPSYILSLPLLLSALTGTRVQVGKV
jgi:hypothetical protein